jgi:ferric-dicitrate binding protein FerR (iron transport regulator)
MNSDRPDQKDDEFLALTAGWCNGTLGADEMARLEGLLLESPDRRALFREYLGLDSALREHGDSVAAGWGRAAGTGVEARPASHPRPAGRPVTWTLGIGLATAIAVLTLVLSRGVADSGVIGRLEQTAGDVRVLGANGGVRTIASSSAPAPLREGDTVRTRGTQSSTAVVYPDGTRLTLVGDTSLTCGDGPSHSVVMHEGTLAASVQPQSGRQPMLLATPTAQLEVLGTRFLIEALANRTDLSVSEGRVRVVRVRDGQTIEVPDGSYAVVSEHERMVARDLPGLTADWEANFEEGLPSGWETGELVTDGLPTGSHGGVRTIREEIESLDIDHHWVLRSEDAWLQGLFATRKSSHLHLTYKMEHPDWINVFLHTRTADPRDPQFSANYQFNRLPHTPAGRWHTVTIPLTEFDRLAGGNPALEELVPFKLMINADADRGLVVDRIWVTSDGPGKVEVKELE